MTDNEIITICEKIESLHVKILKSKFAEKVTESEMLSLILAVRELNLQKAEIEKLQEVIFKKEDLMQILHTQHQLEHDEFVASKAEIERLKAENAKLKHEMSYMIRPNTIGDTHEMGAW